MILGVPRLPGCPRHLVTSIAVAQACLAQWVAGGGGPVLSGGWCGSQSPGQQTGRRNSDPSAGTLGLP